MTARTLLIPLLALAAALVLLAACGGGGEEEQLPGHLTDPRSVPTATLWADPPEPIILGPDVLTPISEPADGEDTGDGEEVQVTPVTPFQVTSDESTNLRASPSTGGGILGTITKGQEATVTGQVAGEAVEAGNDLWYQLEDGGFVYSGAVKKKAEE